MYIYQDTLEVEGLAYIFGDIEIYTGKDSTYYIKDVVIASFNAEETLFPMICIDDNTNTMFYQQIKIGGIHEYYAIGSLCKKVSLTVNAKFYKKEISFKKPIINIRFSKTSVNEDVYEKKIAKLKNTDFEALFFKEDSYYFFDYKCNKNTLMPAVEHLKLKEN